MRIVAGSLGGRVFDSPNSHRTHPMSDRVRGALFNVLGELDGLTVLDAFAGSGALSFEALSRGAQSVVTIDNDRDAQRVVDRNVQTLELEGKMKLVKASSNAWLNTNPSACFDVVLCDPPYDNLQMNLLVRLAERVKKNGLIVFSLPPKTDMPIPKTIFELKVVKDYGDAQLVFYRRIS